MGMTDRDRKVLGIVLAVIVLGGYWFLVLGKKRSAIADAQAAQVTAQADLAASKQKEDAVLKVAKVKPAAYSRLLRLGKAIPVDKDFESLLVQINGITVDSEVSFTSLTVAAGAGGAGAGATGTTTCDASAATGASGATGASAPAATVATGASNGVTGSTAVSSVGKNRDRAKNAVSDTNNSSSATDTASSTAIDCADSPTLTDIAAKAAGLETESYTLNFSGSFYNLKDVFNGILDLVTVHNGKVGVSGRLLDINSISLSVTSFPELGATVNMTGYKLPAGAAAAEGASSGAVTPSASAAAATTTANSAAPAQAGGQ
jgi:hypothetical protein